MAQSDSDQNEIWMKTFTKNEIKSNVDIIYLKAGVINMANSNKGKIIMRCEDKSTGNILELKLKENLDDQYNICMNGPDFPRVCLVR